ncbi:RAG1-activating protein 1 like protein [Trachymyrmex zeteki]|uniref:Sugar transporter SWEET n=1 Tax=Mycetomoellerius zeteki TaxID=64791 RepID=A0A151X4R5_9HYME|nr:RAG1-activating protein 1 like protein [Trachymyrmex zeteki]
MPNTRKSVGTARPCRPRKKKFNYNPDKIEAETEYASTSAKKIKDASYDDIEIDVGHNNVIINFLTVFTFLSQCLKCKKCDGDVTFSRTCDRGLGFNLVIKCKCNDKQRVSSSPLVNGAYEINRRLMFVMRILGLGLRSINTFCLKKVLMELSSGFGNGTYYAFITNLLEAAKNVIKTKNTEILPFPLIFMGTLVSFQWLLYGLIIDNVFIIFQNAIGFMLSISQLSLFVIFPSKKSQLELSNEHRKEN